MRTQSCTIKKLGKPLTLPNYETCSYQILMNTGEKNKHRDIIMKLAFEKLWVKRKGVDTVGGETFLEFVPTLEESLGRWMGVGWAKGGWGWRLQRTYNVCRLPFPSDIIACLKADPGEPGRFSQAMRRTRAWKVKSERGGGEDKRERGWMEIVEVTR